MAQPNKGQRVETIILNGIWKEQRKERNPLNNCMTKLGNNKNNNKECQKNEKVKPLQRMTWAATVEDMFLNFLHSFLTLMFEQRLLEFVVERWVCSVRVFIAFRTQRVPIYLPSNKVPTLGDKTMMWYHWFSKGSNQQLLCTFPFSINFFITFYVFFLKISCATPKGARITHSFFFFFFRVRTFYVFLIHSIWFS